MFCRKFGEFSIILEPVKQGCIFR